MKSIHADPDHQPWFWLSGNIPQIFFRLKINISPENREYLFSAQTIISINTTSFPFSRANIKWSGLEDKKIHKRYWRKANTKCLIINFYVKLLCFWQCRRSGSIESGSGSKDLLTRKWKKYSWKFFFFFLLETAICRCRKSLQPSKENIQHLNEWNLFPCSYLWGIFALLDPDSRAALYPDPQPWLLTVSVSDYATWARSPQWARWTWGTAWTETSWMSSAASSTRRLQHTN